MSIMISSIFARRAPCRLRSILQQRTSLAAASGNSIHLTVNSRAPSSHACHTPQSTHNNTSVSFHTSSPTLRPLEELGRQKFNEAPPLKWNTDLLTKEQIAKVDKIFHKILWLDMVEAHMLNECIKEHWNIKFSAKQTKSLEKFLDAQLLTAEEGAAASSSGGEEEAKEEAGPQLVELFLAGFDAKSKIKVIKEVRAIAGLGLKEAKELVESAPKSLQKDLKPEQAEELKAKLEAVGAQVEVK